VSLPFLQKKNWPRKAVISGESKYGFSEEDDISESAIKELIHALETKDHKMFMSALEALVELIRSSHASSAQ
jgi:hypothetical protein